MNQSRLLSSGAIAAAIAGLSAGSAAAQQPPPQVEAVVVTARKREENIQNIPVAVTSISSAEIEGRTLSELKDIQDVAPNLLFTESQGLKGTSRIYIRGVGENNQIFTTDPAVGVYVDGIPLSRPQGSNLGLLDVERVEVLRGPQGTTFGKNTIGGSVNFVSKLPGDVAAGTLMARLGNYEAFTLLAAAEVPLSDTLALRVSGTLNRRDGFVENTYDGEDLNNLDNWSLRAIARWRPSERSDLVVSADYFRRHEKGNVAQLLSYSPSSPLVAPFEAATLARYGIAGISAALDGDPFRAFYPGGLAVRPGQPQIADYDLRIADYEQEPDPRTANQRIWGGYAIASYDLAEEWQLKSLTSYRRTLSNSWLDSFGAAVPISLFILEENAEESSQEFQIIGSDLAGRLDLITGLFYGVTAAGERGVQWFQPELMAASNLSTARDKAQKTKSLAAFVNATLSASERLQFTLGARWTRDHKRFHLYEEAAYLAGIDIGFGPARAPARPNPDGSPNAFDREKDWSAWSGVVAAQYHWTPAIMTYASWSRGFRSGGFTGTARTVSELQPYDPEFVNSLELGLRSSYWRNRLRLNLTGFLADYTDRQMLVLVVDQSVTPFVTRQVVHNAGKSRQQGLEAEFFLRLNPHLELNGAYGLTDAKYRALSAPFFSGSTIEQNLRLSLPQTPKHTFNLGATFRGHLPRVPGEFTFRVDYAARSRIYYDVANSASIAEDGYGLYNARLSWASDDRGLEMAIWARNVGDERYRTDGVAVAGAFSSAFFGDPRTYGVELKKEF